MHHFGHECRIPNTFAMVHGSGYSVGRAKLPLSRLFPTDVAARQEARPPRLSLHLPRLVNHPIRSFSRLAFCHSCFDAFLGLRAGVFPVSASEHSVTPCRPAPTANHNRVPHPSAPSTQNPEPRTHPSAPFFFSIISTNLSNRYWLSCGPGLPSGWYCTENTGSVGWANPSTEPSFRLTWLT